MDEIMAKIRCLEIAAGLAAQHHIQTCEIESFADRLWGWFNKKTPRLGDPGVRAGSPENGDDIPF